MFAPTPSPPYYAVIFTSLMSNDTTGYEEMSERMMILASQQAGFLGIESVRDRLGITISYWKDKQSILEWKKNIEHQLARKYGKERWYKRFEVRIARVERAYSFGE